MNTLTKNIALLTTFCIAGLALITVKAQGLSYFISDLSKSNLAFTIETGKTFTLKLDENTTSGENYPKWVLVNHSNNLTYIKPVTYVNPESKKVGERKAVFTFKATNKKREASVTFKQVGARSSNTLADSERTFTFTIG